MGEAASRAAAKCGPWMRDMRYHLPLEEGRTPSDHPIYQADIWRPSTQFSPTWTPTSSLYTQHLFPSLLDLTPSAFPCKVEDTLSLTLTHNPRFSVPLELSALGPHTALQEALNSSPHFLKACPGVKLQRFLFLCHFSSLLPFPLVPPTLSGHTVSQEVGVHEDHYSSCAASGPPIPRQFLRTISYPPLCKMISVNCLAGITYRWGRLSPHIHPGP